MRYRAVIFDLDGTLLNTLRDLHAAVNVALKGQGFGEKTLDEVRSYVGNGVRVLFERALPEESAGASGSKRRSRLLKSIIAAI